MGAASPSPDDSGVVEIGSVLDGRYRIDAVLGKGGMGRVYKGEHTGIGRAVAIKVLHSALGGNKEATQRFQREALASGRLDHPNIVGVSDFGVIDGGSLYLVMEALEGEPLGKRLEREKRIPWPVAIDIIRSVLAGLRHAHDKGVVHRDIKPDNIFLATKDGEEIVKILDFGIAKLYAGSADDPAMTRAGLTVGTPQYLSPEQAVGGAITPAADIYSTSIVLYEMLAGTPPFNDEDPLAMLTAHVSREPPPFAQTAPGVEIPPALEALVMRGLGKIKEERVPSASAYIAELDAILAAAGYAVRSPALTPARGTSSLSIPPVTATPMPFAVDPASGVHNVQTSPGLPSVKHPVSVAETGAAIPKKWLKIGGVIVAIGLAIVIAVSLLGKKDDNAQPAQPGGAPFPSTAAPTGPDRDMRLKAALHDLEAGKTCADRKAAIADLVELGDPRAIPDLKRARHRPYGGVLGIGENDANACLTRDADAAIKQLSQK